MTIVRLAMALLFVTVLATGCAYYYRVVDTTNGQVYYTTSRASRTTSGSRTRGPARKW